MNQSLRKRKNTFLQWIPGIIISLAAVLLLLYKIDLQELLKSFSKIQFLSFLAAILLFLLSLIIRSIAWRFFMQNQVTIRDAFFIENEGYLLNNLLPFRLGELGRAFIMGRVSGLGSANIFSTIVLDRICDVAIAGVFITITLPKALGQTTLPLLSWVLIGIILFGISALLILGFNQGKIQKYLENHEAKNKLFELRIKKGIIKFLQGLAVIRNPKYFIAGFTCLNFSWGIAIIEYYLLMQNFILTAPVWWTILGLGALAFGVAIPSAPANAGVFEVALIGALALVGVSTSIAMAYAMVIHLMHFVINCILGLIGLRIHGSSLSELWKDLRNNSSTHVIQEK